MITLLLLVRATYKWVLFFAHIPFVVNRTFNATRTASKCTEQTLLCIGVEAGKFWGCEGFPQTCPKDFLGHFLCEYFLMKTVLGAIFLKSKDVGYQFCSWFQGVCPGFDRFCEVFTDFARIFTKSKLLGVRFHPMYPRFLHRCCFSIPTCSSWNRR